MSAVSNQKAFDDFYYDLMGLDINIYSSLPRPTKWASSHSSLLWAIAIISKRTRNIWVYLLFYIYLAFKFLLIIKRRAISVIKFDSKIVRKTINLIVCDRSITVLLQLDNNKSDFWIKGPLVNLASTESTKINGSIIDASHILTLKELKQCFFNSVRVHKNIINKTNSSLWFQTYNILEWMITWYAMCKLRPSKIKTSEHHDRWAVLADSYCTMQEGIDFCELVLVQHGLEFESTYLKIKNLTGLNGLPYKLKNLDKLHVYNTEQAEIFRRNIIDKSAADYKIKYYVSRLKLKKVKSEKLSVLIVGHKICEGLHIEICDYLNRISSIDVYYKPHPTAMASDKAKAEKWFFIEDNTFFPRVDFLISYPSTLVVEYHIEGVEAVLHHISQHLDDALIGRINTMIEVVEKARDRNVKI